MEIRVENRWLTMGNMGKERAEKNFLRASGRQSCLHGRMQSTLVTL